MAVRFLQKRYFSPGCWLEKRHSSPSSIMMLKEHYDCVKHASSEEAATRYILKNEEWFLDAMKNKVECRIPTSSKVVFIGLEPGAATDGTITREERKAMQVRHAATRLISGCARMDSPRWYFGESCPLLTDSIASADFPLKGAPEKGVVTQMRLNRSSFWGFVAGKMAPGLLLDTVTGNNSFEKSDILELTQALRPLIPAQDSSLQNVLDDAKLKEKDMLGLASNLIFGSGIGWGNVLPIAKTGASDWPFEDLSDMFSDSSHLKCLGSQKAYVKAVLPSRIKHLKDFICNSQATTIVVACGNLSCDVLTEMSGSKPAVVEVEASVNKHGHKDSFYHTTLSKCGGAGDVHVFGIRHPCSSTKDEWWIEAFSKIREIQPSLKEQPLF